MKKFIIAVAVLLAVLVVSIAIAFWQIGLAGNGRLEGWIGGQLQAVANSYLGPKLSFDGLDYEYPGTVRLKHLHLTAADPANPGKTIDILATQDATVTLGAIPRIGKPIVVTKVTLNQPLFQAVAISPTNSDLVGFAQFLKPVVSKPDEPSTQPSDLKLSNFFQIHQVQLNDGKIVYDPRIAGTNPMVLDHIWTEADIAAATDGSYDFAIGLNRKPLFNLDISTRFNIDSLTFSNTAIVLDAMVDPNQIDYLPPEVQQLVKQYQVQGKLSVYVTGGLPIRNFRKGDVNVDARLTRANITTDDYKIPISLFDLQAHLQDGKVVIPSITVKALKGTLEANGIVTLNRRLDSDVQVEVFDMVIDELFVTPGTAEKPKLAGRLKANMNADVSLSALMVRLAPDASTSMELAKAAPELLEPLPEKWGTGQIHLDRGRLVNVPVLEQLTRAISKTASLLGRKRKSTPTEKADVNFDFMGDQIKINEFSYAGEIVAARGNGAIALDERLDLLMNGGPIEKLTTLLGKQIGSLVSNVTDSLVSYKVGGTIDEPKIGVIVGSGTVQDVAGDITDKAAGGVKKVGETVGNGAKGILKGVLGL